jgi:hypothetical protein
LMNLAARQTQIFDLPALEWSLAGITYGVEGRK